MSSSANFKPSAEIRKSSLLARIREAIKTLNATLKPRYLGLGFVWAWIYCAFQTPILFPNLEGVSINADISWLASALTVVVSLFAFGTLWRKSNLRLFKALHWIAGMLVAAGTLVSMLCAVYFPALTGVSIFSGILSGIGTGWLCIFWADAMTQLDIEHIEVMVPSAFGVTLLCSLIVPAIQGFVGVLVIAALPIVSSLLLLSVYEDSSTPLSAAPHLEETLGAPMLKRINHRESFCGSVRSTLLKAGVTIGIFYAAIGFMDGMSILLGGNTTHLGFDLPAFMGSLCGLVMALGFVLFTIRIDFQSLFRWLTPLMVLMIALIPWPSPTIHTLSEVIGAIADTVMQVIVYVYIISLARKGTISAALGVGIVQGFVQLGVLVGNIAGERTAYFASQSPTNFFAITLTLICIIAFATLLVPQRKQSLSPIPVETSNASLTSFNEVDQEDSIAAVSHEPKEDSSINRTEGCEAASPREDFSRCAVIAQQFDLSRREAEILEYLAKGRSQPYIREELMLSKNTVATHVKHIYQKLNVHSKQELIDLVEGRKTTQ